MKLTTVLRAERGGDVPVWISAPATNDGDKMTEERIKRMNERLEQAKATLGQRYVLHPDNRVEKNVLPFLEKTK